MENAGFIEFSPSQISSLYLWSNKMYKLVLVRHGQSTWNLENRFTGWTDVDLTDLGKTEAHEAGKLLLEDGYDFDIAYTSVLKRAIKTLGIIQEEMNLE